MKIVACGNTQEEDLSALLRVIQQISNKWPQELLLLVCNLRMRELFVFSQCSTWSSLTQLCKAKKEILLINNKRKLLFLFLSHLGIPWITPHNYREALMQYSCYLEWWTFIWLKKANNFLQGSWIQKKKFHLPYCSIYTFLFVFQLYVEVSIVG